MHMLSAGEAARALGISLDTLRRWDRQGKIAVSRDAANRRVVAASEIARIRGGGTTTVRLSARNRLQGTVRAVQIDGMVGLVEIDITVPARVVALVTRDAVDELGLRPGDDVAAVIKSTSVMVER